MYIGIDLGSTNIKAAVYDGKMNLVDRKSKGVEYIRENGFVEFNAEEYCQTLLCLLKEMFKQNNIKEVKHIAFTGQAETLVIINKDGKPLTNAVSWMDERSSEECKVLEKQFTARECEAVTGQQAILPTWPATKILWFKNNRQEIFNNADCYMLLKDYVVYFLTGKKFSDMSIATFSFYFDIYNKCYWQKMLNAIGITENQLPPLCEPCTTVGEIKAETAKELGIFGGTKVNVGTLDHFAGMIGTANVNGDGVTLSTGTVMAMAVQAKEQKNKNLGVAMHYGFLPNTHIMLPVAESGGVSLEWFKTNCLNADYDTLNKVLAERKKPDILFLPYLVGTNAPEFHTNATGVFWGLRGEHDAFDMAYAVMEGVAFVLKKNCDAIKEKGTNPNCIIATGGGAKSDIWCQLQADITGLPIKIPAEKEAACLGAAIIALVADGVFENFQQATKNIAFVREFTPNQSEELKVKYRKFNELYNASLKIADIK